MEINYSQSINRKTSEILQIMKAIAAHFGNNCEVVLHDLKKPENSLIAMAGNVTNRSVGAPITNFVLEIIQKEGDHAEDRIGYISKTKEGKELKSTTIFIRENEKVRYVLCINYCISDFVLTTNIINEFCQEKIEAQEVIEQQDGKEFFANDVEEFLDNIINETLKQKNERKLQYMERQEKIDLIRSLDRKGVFLVKGAVDLIASHLGASKFTVYNYLDEARSNSNPSLA